MFTGLVQAVGTVRDASDARGGRRLRVAEPGLAPKLELGESIAVAGACLTVVARTGDTFDFEVGPETLEKTTLGQLAAGARVNLERALRVGDLLGGHFVTGHVDCVGEVLEEVVTGEWLTVWFGIPEAFEPLLVSKGSVAVDGVSLTIVDVRRDRFSVMLIPHTRTHTTLGLKAPGAAVNLEFDMIAKHVHKLFKRTSIII
ncbi:riboflavin synthase [Frigoriglobus tundricola]|uniref:Riboflavin synthase n=1 Tax=Frigoriglobus tundricola TaxID=2774151 RepID=A0A6M5YWE3_9BACT|nr:riboflavin synthase [Frigoriglobus tundricola]QJW97621.1 Riboflavin synthase eubacterial/eukaryotic [Frigoriglobus tundricola]